MEPMTFLDGLSGYMRNSTGNSADKPIRLAVIDPAYDGFASPYPNGTPPAKVTFEGESTLSGKSYPVASGYVPQAGARVYMVPIGTTYLITGAATQYTSQGFYSEPDASYYGVEFGGGSFWDNDVGLYIENDAEIVGDLTVGGIGKVQWKIKTADTARTSNTTFSADPHLSGLVLDVGWWEIWCVLGVTGTDGNLKTRWDFTGTWNVAKQSWGPSTIVENMDRNNTTIRLGVHDPGTQVDYGFGNATSQAGVQEFSLVQVTGAGNMSISWAQITSFATATTVRTRSYIRATRVQ